MIDEAPPRVLRTLVATLFLCVMTAQAPAIIAAPEPIDTPLASPWQAPVRQFLSDLQVRDVEQVLSSTKAFGLGPSPPDEIVVRLEHNDFCSRDLCLTIIGEIKDGQFRSNAMFSAGKMVTRGDVYGNIAGMALFPPLMFFTTNDITKSDGSVFAFKTMKGWIVAPSANPPTAHQRP